MSAAFSLPSRAFSPSSPSSLPISKIDFLSTSRITGTIRPFGVSTAKPTWKYFFSTRFSPLASSEALNSGNSINACTTPLMMKVSGVSLAPTFAASVFSALRRVSMSVMSQRSCCVTCGTFTHEACNRGPEIFLTRFSGFVSISPNLAKSTLGTEGSEAPPPAPPPCITDLTNCLTSSWLMRPFTPVPLTRPRSTPSSRANLRTDGEAWALEKDASLISGSLPPLLLGGDAGPWAACGAACLSSAGVDSDWLAAGSPFSCLSAAGAPVVSSKAITSPSETLSPVPTFSSLMTPASGAGTSIAALSVSSVISGDSFSTSSPAFTSRSMISTPSKSPISGTFTSMT